MRTRGVLIFFLSAISFALFPVGVPGQDLAPSSSSSASSRRQNLVAHESWFMRGRTAPPEQSAADFRLRAHALQRHTGKMRGSRLVEAPTQSKVSGGWQALGPAPLASDASGFGLRDYGWVAGRATSIVVDPEDVTANTVYVGGAYGGVWRSSNAATPLSSDVVWTPLLDDQPTLSVGSIAIQPGNSNVLLVGTGETNSATDSYYGLGMLRSADGGATWSLISSSIDGRSFKGMGFSKIAFSAENPSIVVGGTGFASRGVSSGLDPGNNRGLYVSSDAGLTWTFATVKDGGTSITSSSVTSVVYNSNSKKFIAAIRRHGFYSSSNGFTWTRLTNQPGIGSGSLSSSACPADAAANSYGCPIYRGEIAVVPGRDEVYVWFMDLPGNSLPETDRGVWRSVGGGPWTQISNTGRTSCGDVSGCGAEHGDYSLEIAAVPNGTVATDLYVGAVNLYRCPLVDGSTSANCSGGAWLNLTHAYGCSEMAKMHPDQHAMHFAVVAGKAVGYFANDGGVYRVLDGFMGLGSGLNGSCAGTNQFESLNGTLGSMTQLISFAQDPTDGGTLLAGAQGNGFPATSQAGTHTMWVSVLSGDGGYAAITPSPLTQWLASAPDVPPHGLNISSCAVGTDCRSANFSTLVDSGDLSGDDGPYYPPYILDPQANGQLLIGTCRVWRAASDRSTFTPLSNNFDTGSGSCTGEEINQVRALAAGGPRGIHGFSNVVFVTTDGWGPLSGSTNPAGGRVFVSTNADTATPAFVDVTGAINPQQYPVSSVAIDPSDPSGQTAFVTIMGFGVGHVFKTTNAGASWTRFGNVESGLPDLPANTALVDADAGQIYVGTDAGVFVSTTSSPNWAMVGPENGFGHMPNVPVTALRMFNPKPETKKIRASTYGRGIWEFSLITTPDFQMSITNPNETIFAGQQAMLSGKVTALNGYEKTVTLSCAGTSQPQTCTPSNASVVPTEDGTPFTVTTSGETGVYPFSIRASETAPSGVTRDVSATLKVVDYAVSGLNPSTVSVAQGEVSSPMEFVVSAYGPFDEIVVLSCPGGLPTGAACEFTPSSSVSPTAVTSVSVTLKITTSRATPTGTFPIVVQADVVGSPAPKTVLATLIVTTAADYAVTVNNSPLSLGVGQHGEFAGTLTALNDYSAPVSITCGSGAPPTCTGGSFVPISGGTEFRVGVSSATAQTYRFDLIASGQDSGRIQHSIQLMLITGSDFNLSNASGAQTISAGGTASYLLNVAPASDSFSNNLTFSCIGTSLPPLSRCIFQPASVPSGATANTVNLSIVTTASTAVLGIGRKMVFYALSLPFLAVLGLNLPRVRISKRAAIFGSAGIVMLVIVLTSCGGGLSEPGPGQGHPGTPPGSYNVKVSAICDSSERQLVVSLVVQ